MAIFYRIAAVLAAIFLALIVVLTALLVAGRIIGVRVPDFTDWCGFAMAASSFLGLAGTFRSGGHIRVNLLISRFDGIRRRILEGVCLSMGVGLVGWLTWAFTRFVWESYGYGDMSTGMIPTPLWIPQLAMLFGAVLLEIAFIQELYGVIRGRQPIYEGHKSAIQSEFQ